jgi:SOS response regulatory protein OraA/RecX
MNYRRNKMKPQLEDFSDSEIRQRLLNRGYSSDTVDILLEEEERERKEKRISQLMGLV